MTFRIAIIVLLLGTGSVAGAQELAVPSTTGEKTLHVRKIEAQIKVDGRLDEPVWETISPVTDFFQTEPDQGAPVSERTEARVFYDEHNLYFGFRCYDSQPAKVVARLGPHDGRTNSDSVNILIDTFRDRRTGYFSASTPEAFNMTRLQTRPAEAPDSRFTTPAGTASGTAQRFWSPGATRLRWRSPSSPSGWRSPANRPGV